MPELTKDTTAMKNVGLVDELLNKTTDSMPKGTYFKTSMTDEEKQASVDKIEEMLKSKTKKILTEKEFKLLRKAMMEDEEVSVISTEDDDDKTVVSMETPDMELPTSDTVSDETLNAEEDLTDKAEEDVEVKDNNEIDKTIDKFLTISANADNEISLSMKDKDVLSIDTDDMDIDINLNQLLSDEDKVSLPLDEPATMKDTEQLEDVELEDEDALEDTSSDENPEEDLDMDSVDETELSVQEQIQLKKIKRNIENVISQVRKFKEACKTKGKANTNKKKVKNVKIKSVTAKKSKKEEDLVKETSMWQNKLNTLLSKPNTIKTQETLTLSKELDSLTKKFDSLLENMVIEDEDVLLKETAELEKRLRAKLSKIYENDKSNEFGNLLNKLLKEEEAIEDIEFSINDDIEDVENAIEKSEDILSGGATSDEEQSVVHITLPSGVSAEDITVKVVEEAEGTPVIQIELPNGVDVDEIDATVGEPLDVKGIEDMPKEVNVEEELPEEETEELPEESMDNEIDDAELSEEDEEKLEEAIKVINKKLLPVAENAKYSAYKASKNIIESAQKPDTSYNTNILKQTHLYYTNQGKNLLDYRYPIADIIEGKIYAIPEAIDKMTEMFNNPAMVKKIGSSIVKIVRTRLEPYLEAMGKNIPWKDKNSNLIITEKGMLLTVCHKREAHDPSAVLKRIREEFDGSK